MKSNALYSNTVDGWSQTKINDRYVCAVGEFKVDLKQDAKTTTKIHRVFHTNKCTNCISYISLKLYTLKLLHCSYMFR
jgi:hypothetical protein